MPGPSCTKVAYEEVNLILVRRNLFCLYVSAYPVVHSKAHFTSSKHVCSLRVWTSHPSAPPTSMLGCENGRCILWIAFECVWRQVGDGNAIGAVGHVAHILRIGRKRAVYDKFREEFY